MSQNIILCSKVNSNNGFTSTEICMKFQIKLCTKMITKNSAYVALGGLFGKGRFHPPAWILPPLFLLSEYPKSHENGPDTPIIAVLYVKLYISFLLHVKFEYLGGGG